MSMMRKENRRNTPANDGMFGSGIIQIMIILLGLFTLGAFFSILVTPDILDIDQNAHALDTFTKGSMRSLTTKISKWLPKENVNLHGWSGSEEEPDWTIPFWTPIDVEFDGKDPTVTMCKLNFKEYSKSPHLYAMFRDFESMSKCQGKNRKREKMSILLNELKERAGTPEGIVIPPTGFVFHESRVGSTLVANTLASDAFSMVFSESAPPANTLLHMSSKKVIASGNRDHEVQVETFRNIVTLMGNSPIHKRMFFKFQSITATKMEIALEAFPNTPFAFVYRNSVQTMMSHMDPRKGSTNSPCLRSMRGATPTGVKDAMRDGGLVGNDYSNAPKEAWCAAHLAMLCESALKAYDKYGVTHDDEGHIRQRGMLINYESLPGAVGRALLPLFGVYPDKKWLTKMTEESKVYSKGKGKTNSFSSDNKDKEDHATDAIELYANSILDKKYVKMATIGLDSLQVISPESYDLMINGERPDVRSVDWTLLKTVPDFDLLPHVKRQAAETIAAAKHAEQLAISEAKLALAFNREKVILSSQSDQKTGVESINESNNDNAAANSSNDGAINLNLRGAASIIDDKAIAKHSHTLPDREFIPWSPWSNTHHSQSFSPMGACGPIDSKSIRDDDTIYPKMFSLVDILNNWNPDDTEIPDHHYDTLCHFDYSDEKQREIAFTYRDAEVPFVAYNIPEVETVVKKWSDIDYLHRRLGSKKYRTELSKDNHFMYWNGGPKKAAAARKISSNLNDGKEEQPWRPPTEISETSFEDFVETAVKGQNQTLEGRNYKYFRVTSEGNNNDQNYWIQKELPFFGSNKESLIIKEPNEKRGIHCRFGMRAVTAETHYDGSRNSIVQLGGMRRWIMFHPNQCSNLYLLPEGHPSARHTQIDLSGNIQENLKKFPKMASLVAHEVILQPGDMLYVPTHWFHHIISLNLNYQCNCRSGRDYVPYLKKMQECGFRG
jgi:hypothetical protein